MTTTMSDPGFDNLIERLHSLPEWALKRAATITEQPGRAMPSGGVEPLYMMRAPLKVRLTVEIAEALMEDKTND